ncbi:putative ribonuclease H-like domain-containing protein [Tanacetum coccineum]
MRVTNGNTNEANREKVAIFAKWLLDISDGHLGISNELDPDNIPWVDIPDNYQIPNNENGMINLIMFIYEDYTLQKHSDETVIKEWEDKIERAATTASSLEAELNSAKTVNGECQIQALVDKKKVIITETSIRRDLKLDDAEGTDCLPTATIFAELERMGAKTSAWNEFSSTVASAIICLATNKNI